MKLKRIVLPVVLVIVCSLLLPNMSFASSDSYLTLELDKTSAQVGEIIKGTLKINNISNFAGFQVNIRYNTNILQPVDPDTGSPYAHNTMPVKNTILLNNDYSIFPMVSHKLEEGSLNFGKSYLFMDKYREGNKPESTGVLGVIGFKVLKNSATEIIFQDSGTLPNSLSGTLVFDWNGKLLKSENYSVKQPPRINPSSNFEPLPTLAPQPSKVNSPVAAINSPAVSDNNNNNNNNNVDNGNDKSDSNGEKTSSKNTSSNLIIPLLLLTSLLLIITAVVAIRRNKKK